MLQVQRQHERRKAALAIVLFVLFSIQSIVAAAELGALDLHSSEVVVQPCTHLCADDHFDPSDVNDLLPGEYGADHCDDCEHCLGCHLTAMVQNLPTYSISDSCSQFTYLVQVVKLSPENIHRPPIA